MKAIITITVEDIDYWDEFINSTIPEIKTGLEEYVDSSLSNELDYSSLKIRIE